MKQYELPDLPYALDALEPLYSSELLELHYAKHHQGYVDTANSTLQAMQEMRKENDYSRLNQLQKTLAFSLSGHVMHSIFWRNLSPDGGGEPDPALRESLEETFGSVDLVREQMTEAATSLQGSGWVTLAWEPLGQGLIIEQVYDHQGNTGTATLPLLVIDCWEHAYYLQYRNEKAKFIKAFWDMVNWKDVAGRLDSAPQLRAA